MELLNIGISPCPNDTFIFYALINDKINTHGIEFNVIFKDVEELNKLSQNSQLDICKISYRNYSSIYNNYQLLKAGGAFGLKVGPMLIAKQNLDLNNISKYKIAIPGFNTSAFFLLQYLYPKAQNFEEIIFNRIEDNVCEGKCDLGLIIHENRFTYKNKGLVKLADLGELWHEKEGLPIPLGAIAVKRDMSTEKKKILNKLIQESIKYAFNNKEEVLEFCRNYASEMDKNVMLQHIETYVNNYSIDIDKNGFKAVETMFNSEKGLNFSKKDIFI